MQNRLLTGDGDSDLKTTTSNTCTHNITSHHIGMASNDGGPFCQECQMAFASVELLRKHKVKFCVGSDVGDPTR